MTRILVANLSYEYPDGTRALQDVSFAIEPGESVGIVGENGAGKSTLLRHLNGSLAPQQGSVRIGEWAVERRHFARVRQVVGMVMQDPDDQLFMPTVFDDVAFGPRNLNWNEEQVHSCAMEALRRVGAEHLAQRPPYRLSGGEKRAVAIATVLSMQPQVLVMDEPTSNLDPKSRRVLIDWLRQCKQTLIVAGHDLDMIADVCARTIVLHQGRIKADAPTLEIFTNDVLLRECELERPLRMQNCPRCGQ